MNKIDFKIIREIDLNLLEINLMTTIIYNSEISENNIIITTILGDVMELRYYTNSNEIKVFLLFNDE